MSLKLLPSALLGCVLAGCASKGDSSPRVQTTTGQRPASGGEVSRDGARVQAREAFYKAVAGDRQAVGAAKRLWRQFLEGDAQDTQATAYLGASTMLEAAHATWPWQKGSLAKQGMALLDRAAGAEPENLEVRFLRGMTNYRLPRFFGRSGVAADDLAFVAARARAAAEAGQLEPSLAAAALYHHGMLCEENGDRAAAVASCRAATEVAPQASAGRAAAQWLARVGSAR